MKCWICKTNEANSREHKIKKELLQQFFGRKFSEEILYESNGKSLKLEGPKNKKVLFPKVICEQCNNALTSPHDKAFSKLIKWVLENPSLIQQNLSIDFSLVFGANWYEQKLNCIKYIAKHVGCKIVTGPYNFDLGALSKLIIEDKLTDRFHCHFIFKESIYDLSQTPFPYFANTSNNSYNNSNNIPQWFTGVHNISWFSIAWIYTSEELKVKSNIYNNPNEEVEIFPSLTLIAQALDLSPIEYAEQQNMSTNEEWYTYFNKYVQPIA